MGEEKVRGKVKVRGEGRMGGVEDGSRADFSPPFWEVEWWWGRRK